MRSAFQLGHHAVEGIDTIITSLVLAFSDVFLSYPIAQNIPDGSSSDFGKENSRSFPAVDDGFELDSFTDVDIGETTESKATKSKIKTEVEHSGSLPALADDVELNSFTDVAVDETTESKAKKSKIKTEL